MKTQYFITGTNTDIGKTFITAGLAKLSASLDLDTAVMKPIQTGTAEYESDLSVIRSLVPELVVNDKELISPYEFRLGASPHLAAREAGELIEPKVIVDAYQKLLATGVDTLLVEGAGGIYVPIVDDYTMLDLMKDLGIPVIIVGTVELGSINHALLSINALKNAGLDIAGIVLNKVPQKPSLIEQDNIETIQKLGNVPLLGVINTLDNPSADSLFTQINTSDFHNLFT